MSALAWANSAPRSLGSSQIYSTYCHFYLATRSLLYLAFSGFVLPKHETLTLAPVQTLIRDPGSRVRAAPDPQTRERQQESDVTDYVQDEDGGSDVATVNLSKRKQAKLAKMEQERAKKEDRLAAKRGRKKKKKELMKKATAEREQDRSDQTDGKKPRSKNSSKAGKRADTGSEGGRTKSKTRIEVGRRNKIPSTEASERNVNIEGGSGYLKKFLMSCMKNWSREDKVDVKAGEGRISPDPIPRDTSPADSCSNAESPPPPPPPSPPSSRFGKLPIVFNPYVPKSLAKLETQTKALADAISQGRSRIARAQTVSTTHSTESFTEILWLDLGEDPQRWAKDVPSVDDRWLEVLALGLNKDILLGHVEEGEKAGAGEAVEGNFDAEKRVGKKELVLDFDLEDYERLEHLGDSIVNMSSRLLAYESYPDVNQGGLDRLGRYATQNNILGLLYKECELDIKRETLRAELKSKDWYERFSGLESMQEGILKAGKLDEMAKVKIASSSSSRAADFSKSAIKREADMFEAYVAAVFLSKGGDFSAVHSWLCKLFKPFQDQAMRQVLSSDDLLTNAAKSRKAKELKSRTEEEEERERERERDRMRGWSWSRFSKGFSKWIFNGS
ncbi:hypothetical protein IE53DRAFT_381466 [Violaceomyces palustris]|uniref:Uncharacterized protein n=1 Tax=Violaceomyces palustris TaxID=1673888 RepID=A0ACD0NR53_9BASI|nr:hypothetical protein IE53DRAFT_381466 [Violaceomyces palustris]